MITSTFKQRLDIPENPLPIASIGAGGIVNDAHLPAYKMAGFRIMGLYDLNLEKAVHLKTKFGIIDKVFDSVDTMLIEASKVNAIYDIAVPANEILGILPKIPDGSAVLIQKPMGETLEEAKEIRDLCLEKKLVAAVNFQLQYAPYMLAAKNMIDKGLIGEIFDMELNMCVYTPWHLWDFLYSLPRMEILYHSIHYLDLIRSFLGLPEKVFASTVKHPKMPNLASTKTSMILHYNNFLQARVITNHGHDFGPKHQTSYFKIEGTKGAIIITIGLSFDYPKGRPPKFEYVLLDEQEDWKELPLLGGWFPDAFIGTMAGLQNHYLDKHTPLPHGIEESYKTMRLVEAAYRSSEKGGVQLSTIN